MNYFTEEEQEKIAQGLEPVLTQKEHFAGGRGNLDNLIGWAKTEQEALAILKADCDDLEEDIEVVNVERALIEYKESARDQNCKMQFVYLPVYRGSK
jgi:hypothetical protein